MGIYRRSTDIYNGKAKRTNNDLQNTAQKTKGPSNMDPTKNRK